MKTINNEQAESDDGAEATLDHRYGRIGISAVAAAIRYQSAAKNPAYAPVTWRRLDWDSEAA